MSNGASATERVVRVFVSSTFRDMQEERDYLVKHTFPELRDRCRARQVEFLEVDLRWGITEEQAERGEVLPICLAEIEYCRPYFIGLLGDRYGWVPARIDPVLVDAQPWLAEHREKSVTELEILHGVLNQPAMKDISFFYFRDPRSLVSLPARLRKDFVEGPTPEESAQYGRKEAERRAEERRRKLAALKERIRGRGVYLREDYPDARTLGAWVLDDLWKAIDERYPAVSVQDDLDRQAAEHLAFAESRAKAYVPRQLYYQRLDSHMDGTEVPLVLVGESGVGKSSLVANWAVRYRNAHPDAFVILHFIGSTPESADYEVILRRVTAEIKRKYHLQEEIPGSLKTLRDSFGHWLGLAAEREGALLILDGLNQLDDRDNARDLGWLPEELPAGIRLIGSTLPGRSLAAVRRRGWQTYKIQGLKQEERRLLVQAYLGRYRKNMVGLLMDRIVTAPQTSSPLYLRVMLEELRVFGESEKLSNYLDHYLDAPDPLVLFDRILERMEGDYEKEREGLVGEALSLLWASHRGLYESELLELLGSRKNPLLRAIWSPLFLSMRESLVSRSGLLGFFHDYLRQAVHNRYLAEPEDEFEQHQRLAQYFESVFSEVGEAGGYRRLCLEAAEDAVRLSQRSQNKRLQAEAYLLIAGSLISVAVGVSHENAALFARSCQMAVKASELAREAGAKQTLAAALCLRARVETVHNPDFGDIKLIDEAVALHRKVKDLEGERDALFDKAVLGMRFGNWKISERSLAKAQEIHQRLEEPDPLWAAHAVQLWGEYYALREWWKKAADTLTDAMGRYAGLKFEGGVCAAKGWLGISLCHLGKIRRGLSLVRSALRVERDVLESQEGVAKWLHALGEYFFKRKEKRRALHVLWLCEALREVQGHSELVKNAERGRATLSCLFGYKRLQEQVHF